MPTVFFFMFFYSRELVCIMANINFMPNLLCLLYNVCAVNATNAFRHSPLACVLRYPLNYGYKMNTDDIPDIHFLMIQ